MENDFEKAFEDLLDCEEFDRAQDALFSVVRLAFKAGWLAAEREKSKRQPVIELAKLPAK